MRFGRSYAVERAAVLAGREYNIAKKSCVNMTKCSHTEEGGGDCRYGVDEAGDGVGRPWSHLKLLDEVHLQGDILCLYIDGNKFMYKSSHNLANSVRHK